MFGLFWYAAAEYVSHLADASNKTDVSELQVRKANLEAELKKYAVQEARGQIPTSVYDELNAPVKAAYDDVIQALAVAESSSQAFEWSAVEDVWHNLGRLQIALQQVIDSVTIDGDQIVGVRLTPTTLLNVHLARDGRVLVTEPWRCFKRDGKTLVLRRQAPPDPEDDEDDLWSIWDFEPDPETMSYSWPLVTVPNPKINS